MKLFGAITELVAGIFRKDGVQQTVEPSQIVTYTADRVVQLPAQDANSILISRDSTDTLTNKSISGSANTLSNINLASQITGTLPLANGGTAATTKTAAFDSLSPGTTKGDLLVHDGTHNVRLPAGADGTVLAADSGQTTGYTFVSTLVNPMTTVGDIIIGGTAGAATRLGVGADRSSLQPDGAGGLSWGPSLLNTGSPGSPTYPFTIDNTTAPLMSLLATDLTVCDVVLTGVTNGLKQGQLLYISNIASVSAINSGVLSLVTDSSAVITTVPAGYTAQVLVLTSNPSAISDFVVLNPFYMTSRKQYITGSTYTNGGISVSSNRPGLASTRSVLVPYQTLEGTWRMTTNCVFTFTSGTTTVVTFTFTGLTFKNTATYFQAASGSTSTTASFNYVTTTPNTGTVECSIVSSTQSTIAFSADFELDSKPTWAD